MKFSEIAKHFNPAWFAAVMGTAVIPPQLFSPLAKIVILLCWGFSAWWFVMSCILILHYLRKIELPFALSWWAFTFPSGTLCLASAVAWKVTGFASGKIFLPGH